MVVRPSTSATLATTAAVAFASHLLAGCDSRGARGLESMVDRSRARAEQIAEIGLYTRRSGLIPGEGGGSDQARVTSRQKGGDYMLETRIQARGGGSDEGDAPGDTLIVTMEGGGQRHLMALSRHRLTTGVARGGLPLLEHGWNSLFPLPDGVEVQVAAGERHGRSGRLLSFHPPVSMGPEPGEPCMAPALLGSGGEVIPMEDYPCAQEGLLVPAISGMFVDDASLTLLWLEAHVPGLGPVELEWMEPVERRHGVWVAHSTRVAVGGRVAADLTLDEISVAPTMPTPADIYRELSEEAQRRHRGFFDEPHDWDAFLADCVSSERERQLPVAPLLQELDLSGGLRVADIGAGPGYLTFPIARELGPKGEVLALDILPEAVAALEERAREPETCPHGNVRPMASEVHRTGLQPRSVDLALLCGLDNDWATLDEVTTAFLDDVASIVREGGRLVVLEKTDPSRLRKLQRWTWADFTHLPQQTPPTWSPAPSPEQELEHMTARLHAVQERFRAGGLLLRRTSSTGPRDAPWLIMDFQRTGEPGATQDAQGEGSSGP